MVTTQVQHVVCSKHHTCGYISHVARLPGIRNCITDSKEDPQGAPPLLFIIACAMLLSNKIMKLLLKVNTKRHGKASLFELSGNISHSCMLVLHYGCWSFWWWSFWCWHKQYCYVHLASYTCILQNTFLLPCVIHSWPSQTSQPFHSNKVTCYKFKLYVNRELL